MGFDRLKAINQKLSKKSIELTLLSDPETDSIIKNWIPTSSIALNQILGGGLPCGRLTEIYGEESAGKSSLVADIIANTQRIGGSAVVIDSEQVFTPARAAAMGVDIKNVVRSSEPTVEGAFNIMNAFLDEYKDETTPLCIIWDSIAASPTQAELEGEIDAHQAMAEKPRLLSKGFRQIQSKVNEHTAVIFINQVREDFKIKFGKTTRATGGRAMRFAASIRLEISMIGTVKEGEKPIGIRCKVVTKKSKVCPPNRTAIFEMYYKGGIDDSGFILDTLVEAELIKKRPPWYTYGEGKKEIKFRAKDFKKFISDLGAEGEKLVEKALESV